MMHQEICAALRTGVKVHTFRSCYTVSYFGPWVFFQALSGKYTKACRRELTELFAKEKPHLTHYWYMRFKRGKFYIFKKPIYPNRPDNSGLFIFVE